MTKTSIDEMMQLFRTLKTSQVRKQLEFESKTKNFRYWDSRPEEWINRFQIIHEFLQDAKEQL